MASQIRTDADLLTASRIPSTTVAAPRVSEALISTVADPLACLTDLQRTSFCQLFTDDPTSIVALDSLCVSVADGQAPGTLSQLTPTGEKSVLFRDHRDWEAVSAHEQSTFKLFRGAIAYPIKVLFAFLIFHCSALRMFLAFLALLFQDDQLFLRPACLFRWLNEEGKEETHIADIVMAFVSLPPAEAGAPRRPRSLKITAANDRAAGIDVRLFVQWHRIVKPACVLPHLTTVCSVKLTPWHGVAPPVVFPVIGSVRVLCVVCKGVPPNG